MTLHTPSFGLAHALSGNPAPATLRAMPPQGQKNQHVFQAPKGTKDLYPQDLAKRRYITNAWRDAAIAHGFNEINGPTFEHLDLYTVKSGEAIVSELFSFRRAKGDTDYALRPEFTPTLARMYAAKANSLPKPTKWFSIGPYFRAERPQRGRLREFQQWNVDVIGHPPSLNQPPKPGPSVARPCASALADAETIACCVDSLRILGLSKDQVKVKIGHRDLAAHALGAIGVYDEILQSVFALLDKRDKLTPEAFEKAWREAGLLASILSEFDKLSNVELGPELVWRLELPRLFGFQHDAVDYVGDVQAALNECGVLDWCAFDLFGVVRGLAYYTGMVFEVIAEGERAVAGGGRYDGLIELFGGPPTPAVGFAIGDIVLSLLLEDKGLMPDGAQLADTLSAAPVSNRPDAFVITGNDELDPIVTQTIATLRRNRLHARGTYKATRNVGKLLKEASNHNAKNVIIIETAETCTVKNLDEGKQKDAVAISALPTMLRR